MKIMALSLITLLFISLTFHQVSGIQVTPNSPCSSVCIDSNDLDYSDPNSSNTKGSDISCQDADFSSSGSGMKWQKCLSCLQNSTFSQGSENDQMWFLYNLRYNFDYCIFGYPNATDIGSSPCITSTACGNLEGALKDGDLGTTGLEAYGYCDADGAAMTGSSYETCLACVTASGDDKYLGNALTALEAGCLQRPATGTVVGLNDTVFADYAIGIVDPTSVPTTDSKKSSPISTGLIAGIIAGVLILIAAVAAFLYIRYRKRKNKNLRSNPRWGRHRPKSSLSFKCQKVLSPTSPKFFIDADDASIDNMTEAAEPARRHIESRPRSNLTRAPSTATSTFQSLSAISQNQAANALGIAEKKTSIQINTGPVPLRSITTNISSVPPTAHYSPSATRYSPASAATTDTYFTTPTSTTQLLPPGFSAYVPADHGVASPRPGPDTMRSPSLGSTTSPSQPTQTSPLLNQHGWPLAAREVDVTFPPPPMQKNSRADKKPLQAFKRNRRESGSPVESRNIQVAFPGPPVKR